MALTEILYIESSTTLREKLTRVCQIIDALEIRALNVTSNSDVDEYSIDDGQTKIRTKYRSSDSISKAILLWEQYKQKLLNKLNGRTHVLRPFEGLR